ncbi:MAG: Na+/H+ antiporter NhaC [Candidatus Nephrothrix sp. EaCA]|nr:MAG: Na+/H+ antiporter NhaC [Candidatus Nephrothrix sp. EaCA]
MTIKKEPTLLHAAVPLVVLVGLLFANVMVFGAESSDGPNQTAMLLASSVGVAIAFGLGYRWFEIERSILVSIHSAMQAMLILMVIGALAGTWLLSGVVPAMIYYGLQILNPTIFLFASCVICSIVSLGTGSSWSTVATVGVALLGIGKALGISEPVIAGAIISGSYCGDKMSPLSDTTNLAPAVAGTNLFTHIRYMLYTTTPSIIITCIIFLIWGFALEPSATALQTDLVLESIRRSFNLNPLLMLVPAAVGWMIVKQKPALVALFVGALLGGLFAVIFQPHVIREVGGEGGFFTSSFVAVMKAISGTIHITSSNPMIADLLTTTGMFGMMNTIWLILCAMIFGGVMESSGLLKVIADHIIARANSTGSLVASTAATCIFFNFTMADQYMAIAVPGRMYADTFRKRGYKPELLSRTLEDSATVTSVLVPWNTCGATQAKVLGVSTAAYFPYCFFCMLMPLMTISYAYLNIKIRRLDDDK